ncbi:AMP-binding protein [Agrococcus casei]|uniref:Long-chain-fatty-acid--CoA ligase n=1 Tax=Agrococcus casei LMG 22410 TaxID=1255656 RepID=A0A1R4GB83_9MICO|nr:AMP-binding protein [Agrococcus casei]SJM65426.1 Long-chain-fatty-acid--CoA ligase [Agrococcus casei LMG 22410]
MPAPATPSLHAALRPQQVLDEYPTVKELLERSVDSNPEVIYGVDWTGRALNRAGLFDKVLEMQTSLEQTGITPGTRVAVALANSLEHIAIVFAVIRIGAIWVPLNTKLKGEALQHQLRDSGAAYVLVHPDSPISVEVESSTTVTLTIAPGIAAIRLAGAEGESAPAEEISAETIAIMYTSGTTGPAKGAQVTNTMLIASVVGAVATTDAEDGDVFYVWEPLIHIGGAQLLLLPLIKDVRLALSERLSVRKFWHEVSAFGATHIHHLGGVLQMLLSAEPSPIEREHGARITWGAGATSQIWDDIVQRFGLKIHECYGSTETSSIVTVNKTGASDGIGQPLPWFETRIKGDSADEGELIIRPERPDLITPGYLNRPDATRESHQDGWWHSGDLVRRADDGNHHFLGRTNDSIRIRGENVSAWQVESVFGAHPEIDQCAAVGVDAQIGEQEILLFVIPVEGAEPDPAQLVEWAKSRMPQFQLPRYVRFMNELPLTPSRRVAKKQLPRDVEGAVDVGGGGRIRTRQP